MNICINIHNNPRNVHKNEKSSRHLDKKWYHGTIQSQMNIRKGQQRFCEWGSEQFQSRIAVHIRRMLAFVRICDDIYMTK